MALQSRKICNIIVPVLLFFLASVAGSSDQISMEYPSTEIEVGGRRQLFSMSTSIFSFFYTMINGHKCPVDGPLHQGVVRLCNDAASKLAANPNDRIKDDPRLKEWGHCCDGYGISVPTVSPDVTADADEQDSAQDSAANGSTGTSVTNLLWIIAAAVGVAGLIAGVVWKRKKDKEAEDEHPLDGSIAQFMQGEEVPGVPVDNSPVEPPSFIEMDVPENLEGTSDYVSMNNNVDSSV